MTESVLGKKRAKSTSDLHAAAAAATVGTVINEPLRLSQRKRTVTIAAPSPVRAESALGGRRAVVIGIDYGGIPAIATQRMGNANDADDAATALRACGYTEIRVLKDDVDRHCRWPSRTNILDALAWLVNEARHGDRLVVYYAGHTICPLTGDPVAIVPIDFARPIDGGSIGDEEFEAAVLQRVPLRASLTLVFDCCRWGGELRLPFACEWFRDTDTHDVVYASIKHTRLDFVPRMTGRVVLLAACGDDPGKFENGTDDDDDTVASGWHNGFLSCDAGGAFARLLGELADARVRHSMPYSVLMRRVREDLAPFRMTAQFATNRRTDPKIAGCAL